MLVRSPLASSKLSIAIAVVTLATTPTVASATVASASAASVTLASVTLASPRGVETGRSAAFRGPLSGASRTAQELELVVGESDPGDLPDAVAAVIQGQALTLVQEGEPVLDIWLVASLPEPTGASTTAVVNYSSIPMGSFLGVLRVHRAHVDYRGQLVPPGTYGLRYLQQPVDGEHAGISFFRDFAALVPLTSTTTVEAIDFEQALAAGLMLNTHPYVLGLWPPRELVVAEPPGLAPIDDMWGILTTVPRDGADPVPVGIIVVGGEPPEGYS